MSSYEELLDEAYKNGLVVFENYLFSESSELKGLIVGNRIALSSSLVTEKERKCILMEEISHSMVNTGNITNLNNSNNRRQEYKAHKLAVKKLVPLEAIVKAVLSLREEATLSATAEELDVTEEFLKEALEIYGAIYGRCCERERYYIYFSPFRIVEKEDE